MGIIYCPVCSRAISSKANIKACPSCYHPFNVQEWQETKVKNSAQEKSELEKRIQKASEEKNKKLVRKEKKEKKQRKERHKTMSKVDIEKERIKEIIEKNDTKERLKTVTRDSLRKAYNIQKKTNGWTFYNENDIVQRTLENRFNFLLVAYTLLLAAYFQPDISDNSKLIILGIGFCLVGLLFIAIFRTKNRFQITLGITQSLEPHDVGPIIHKENEVRNNGPFNKMFRKNTITGFYIPLIMILSIAAGIIFHILKCFGVLK